TCSCARKTGHDGVGPRNVGTAVARSTIGLGSGAVAEAAPVAVAAPAITAASVPKSFALVLMYPPLSWVSSIVAAGARQGRGGGGAAGRRGSSAPLASRRAPWYPLRVEFRLLGPLEVVGDHGAFDIDAHNPRALLALLLLHANEVVPAEQLIEALWEGSPPAT